MISASLPISAVDPDGYWAGVDERNLHVSTKDPAADVAAEFVFEGETKCVVKWLGDGGSGGFEKGGAIAFFGGGMEGKLTDDDHISVGVLNTAVHFSVLVLKDPQTRDFPTEPIHVFRGISFLDTEQNQQAVLDG